MPLPVAVAATYLLINLAVTVWIVREETHGRALSDWLVAGSALLRYGPPLLGAMYLVTRAGDWPFVLFVLFFFSLAFFLLNGLLNYPTRPPK
jgi:hypothetical protein